PPASATARSTRPMSRRCSKSWDARRNNELRPFQFNRGIFSPIDGSVMVARYNRISLMAGVPGIILHVAGEIMRHRPGQAMVAGLLFAAGTGLLLVGLAFNAVAIGR